MNHEIQIEHHTLDAESNNGVKNTELVMDDAHRRRFLAKIVRGKNEDECWGWTASHNNFGYGSFRINLKTRAAHRIAWRLFVGEIPDGKCVLHKCDTPACCNPSHLFLGTKLDNVLDMFAKGRNNTMSGDRHPYRLRPEIVPRGMNHPRRKLDEYQVKAIRSAYSEGRVSQRELAENYSVSRGAITAILRRDNWFHI